MQVCKFSTTSSSKSNVSFGAKSFETDDWAVDFEKWTCHKKIIVATNDVTIERKKPTMHCATKHQTIVRGLQT